MKLFDESLANVPVKELLRQVEQRYMQRKIFSGSGKKASGDAQGGGSAYKGSKPEIVDDKMTANMADKLVRRVELWSGLHQVVDKLEPVDECAYKLAKADVERMPQ